MSAPGGQIGGALALVWATGCLYLCIFISEYAKHYVKNRKEYLQDRAIVKKNWMKPDIKQPLEETCQIGSPKRPFTMTLVVAAERNKAVH